MSTVVGPLAHAAGLAYREAGDGPPVVALHGAYSTSAEVEGFLPAMLPSHRLVIPDLPGMGDSSTTDTADAVARLVDFVDEVIGDQPFAVVGHSFGAHLARGLVARFGRRVRGLALLCPMVPDEVNPAEATVVVDDGSAADLPDDQREEFTGYFVIRTAATVDRFRAAVLPTSGRYDADAVATLMHEWQIPTQPADGPYSGPVLIMVGRLDSLVGWRQHVGLLEAYPRASAMVIADAGHALPHEQPEAVAAALHQWIERSEAQPRP